MRTDEGDFHSSAFIFGPNNTLLFIRDKRKSTPFWKPPGGKKQLIKPFGKKTRGETPLETVIREVHEETGVWLKKQSTIHVLTNNMGHYNKHFFFSKTPSFRGLIPLSREYEETRVFSIEDLMWLPDFHPEYREIFMKHIKPLLLSS